MIQRRLRQRFGVHARQDRLAAPQHVKLQIAGEAVALPPPLLAIIMPQVRFLPQPVSQRARWDLEEFADARQVAVMLVNLVQRLDLG